MTNFQGTFVWYELMTTDTKAAEAFYHAVIGWNAKDSGIAGMSYTIVSAGEDGVGGMMALTGDMRAAGARPGWIGYVAVDDVDAGAARASALGGTVHRPPADIPGVGRFAIIADPQGGVLALFAPGQGSARPPVPPGTPGHGGWHEFYAKDREAAFAFYSRMFGWTKGEAIDMGPMGVYQIFNQGDAMLGGMMTKPEQMPAPAWNYYFNIAAIEPAAARVKAGGGQVVHGPMQVPGGHWIVQCLDPQGALFALVGPKE